MELKRLYVVMKKCQCVEVTPDTHLDMRESYAQGYTDEEKASFTQQYTEEARQDILKSGREIISLLKAEYIEADLLSSIEEYGTLNTMDRVEITFDVKNEK